MNKYVDFISDSDFLDCIKWVCSVYPDADKKIDIVKLQKNTIDPFKMLFDMLNGEISFDDWIHSERIRQKDKTINNRIGEFHQKVLGKVQGWIDLGTGDESGVDLKKDDNSIFIELKNKHNTMNSGSIKNCRLKLDSIVQIRPNSIAYWAFIVSKNGDANEAPFRISGMRDNPQVKKIWGSKVYELVTGDPKALEKLWKALPKAIKDVLETDYEMEDEDKNKLFEFFNKAFNSFS